MLDRFEPTETTCLLEPRSEKLLYKDISKILHMLTRRRASYTRKEKNKPFLEAAGCTAIELCAAGVLAYCLYLANFESIRGENLRNESEQLQQDVDDRYYYSNIPGENRTCANINGFLVCGESRDAYQPEFCRLFWNELCVEAPNLFSASTNAVFYFVGLLFFDIGLGFGTFLGCGALYCHFLSNAYRACRDNRNIEAANPTPLNLCLSPKEIKDVSELVSKINKELDNPTKHILLGNDPTEANINTLITQISYEAKKRLNAARCVAFLAAENPLYLKKGASQSLTNFFSRVDGSIKYKICEYAGFTSPK